MSLDIKTYLEKVSDFQQNSTNQLILTCIWCEGKNKLYVDSKSGNYICFRCEKKGRKLTGIISELEGVSYADAKEFFVNGGYFERRTETMESLTDKVLSLNRSKSLDKEQDAFEKVDVCLPKEFIPIYSNGRKARIPKYLKTRGVSLQLIRDFGIGYCLEGYYADRIILPIECDNGNSFTARSALKDEELRYKNPKGAGFSKLLYGWKQLNKNADVVICEGPFDVLRLCSYGVNAVGLLGKKMLTDKLAMFKTLNGSLNITIMLDPEEKTAPYDICKALSLRFNNIYIAKLPEGIDPGAAEKDVVFESILNAEKYTRFSEIKNMMCDIK